MEHVVQNVLAPYAVECVNDKLQPGGRYFMLSVSTDAPNKGNRKFFPIVVKFYHVNGGGITNAFIDFCEQPDQTSSYSIQCG